MSQGNLSTFPLDVQDKDGRKGSGGSGKRNDASEGKRVQISVWCEGRIWWDEERVSRYDIGELKDMINNTRSDTAHVKRIVLACERDMEVQLIRTQSFGPKDENCLFPGFFEASDSSARKF